MVKRRETNPHHGFSRAKLTSPNDRDTLNVSSCESPETPLRQGLRS